jgi:hypothetical protein
MPDVDLKTSQHHWLHGLTARFGSECVKEWSAFARTTDRYSPRLDIAVGPFSTEAGARRTAAYRSLAQTHRRFLEQLWGYHSENERQHNASSSRATPDLESALDANRNARCFLAIEIENEVSRKHLMGGIINAVSLGHLGVAIGWNEGKVHAMFRARAYLYFLESVDKPTMRVANLLILSRDQANEAFMSTDESPGGRT